MSRLDRDRRMTFRPTMYEVARAAVIEWMARHGMTSDRHAYEDLAAYADEVARHLVTHRDDQYRTINGMTLHTGATGYWVSFRD